MKDARSTHLVDETGEYPPFSEFVDVLKLSFQSQNEKYIMDLLAKLEHTESPYHQVITSTVLISTKLGKLVNFHSKKNANPEIATVCARLTDHYVEMLRREYAAKAKEAESRGEVPNGVQTSTEIKVSLEQNYDEDDMIVDIQTDGTPVKVVQRRSLKLESSPSTDTVPLAQPELPRPPADQMDTA